MPKTINEGAIFVADVHYPHHGEEIFDLLDLIESQNNPDQQLFLMGDIFDLLFGYNHYIQGFSSPLIQRLQKLSREIEIHYIEGNHDFCLKELFPHIQVYPRSKQPIKFKIQEHNVYLSHGDRYARPLSYEIYSRILRNPFSLTLLRPFERTIIDHRMQKLQQKKICSDFESFETHVHEIRTYYPKEALIIEGHFHQGKKIQNYISLPSLVCQKQIGIVKRNQIEFIPIASLTRG